MASNLPYVANLVNSIIGVSVLAMPYCLKNCGLVLGLVSLLSVSYLTYISCNMLISSAVTKRRSTYEYLALSTVGPSGKFAVELSMIGLMLGTCIAFYVVIGDLATEILSTFVENSPSGISLRTYVIVFTAFCIALPLGLMKNLAVLGVIGFFSLTFYFIFVCVMFSASVSRGFLTFEWMNKAVFWQPSGLLQCLPIFSLAFACQCQLFTVYDNLENKSLARMQDIVFSALRIVTSVYCTVAVLGYTSFLDHVEGNVLRNFPITASILLIKLGFASSVVVGFPLMIFPCRQSIHTLFFTPKESSTPLEGGSVSPKSYIEPFTFKTLTLGIVVGTMIVAILIPNVETVLGLTGATMGSFICFIFPAIIFSKATSKSKNSVMTKFVFGVGCLLLIFCTYANLFPSMPSTKPIIEIEIEKPLVPVVNFDDLNGNKKEIEAIVDDHRHEPANPISPDDLGPVDFDDDASDKNENQLPIDVVDKKLDVIPVQMPEDGHSVKETPDQDEQIEDYKDKYKEESQDQRDKSDLSVSDDSEKDKKVGVDTELLEKIKEQHKLQHSLIIEQEKLIKKLEVQQESIDEKDAIDEKKMNSDQDAQPDNDVKEVKKEENKPKVRFYQRKSLPSEFQSHIITIKIIIDISEEGILIITSYVQ